MTDARTVLRGLYRRVHGREAVLDEAVLIWAAEQLALALDGVEHEADAPPEAPNDTTTADDNARHIAQLNDEARR